MKKLNLWAFAALMAGAFAFAACSSSNEDNGGGNGGNGGNGDNGGGDTPTMTMAALSGIVFDSNGNTLANVTVENGTATTTTGANGVFTLNQVNAVNGRAVLKFKKSGYMDIVRSMAVSEGEKWEVVMVNDDDTKTVTYNANSAQSITSSQDSKMKVDMPANGYKVDATGAAYTGQVTTKMLYLDPDDKNFAAKMPGGDLAAVRTDGSDAMLLSYGMTKVDMTGDQGQKLQLKEGEKATLTFPVPDTLKTNTPANIPLWSFNEETGLWEEEGSATYDSANGVYVGQVSHFSWVNLDCPEVRATIRVWVNSGGKAVAHTPVHIGQITRTTNSNGFIETFIPQRTAFDVTILPEDFGYYSPQKFVHVNANQATSSNSIVEVRLDMPTLTTISGKVVNHGTGSSVATIWLKLATGQANIKKTYTSLDGQFELYGPGTYRGPADIIVQLSDGTQVTKTIYMDGRNFNDLQIDINSDASGLGGIVEVSLTDGSGLTGKMEMPKLNLDDLEGVVIEDGYFMIEPNYHKAYDYSDGFTRVSMGIPNFKDGITSSDSVNMYFTMEGNGIWKEVRSPILHGDISKNGTSYTIKFRGTGYYRDNDMESKNYNQENANISGEYTAPLLARVERRNNVTASDVPSFTPLLAGKPNYAVVITESPALGQGVFLCYNDSNITKSDFEGLKARAAAVLGEPYESSATNSSVYYDENVSYVRYFKDGQYLELTYNAGYFYPQEYLSFQLLNHERGMAFGRLSIKAFNAMTIPITSLNPVYHAKKTTTSFKAPWHKK